MSDSQLPKVTGGPLKPGFGLSGAVLQPDKSSRRCFRVFMSSVSTQSRPSLTADYWFWIRRTGQFNEGI